jgi:hypothetical protein
MKVITADFVSILDAAHLVVPSADVCKVPIKSFDTDQITINIGK